MRRQFTEARQQLHNKTHNFTRNKHRQIARDDLGGHIQSGERDRIMGPSLQSPLRRGNSRRSQ